MDGFDRTILATTGAGGTAPGGAAAPAGTARPVGYVEHASVACVSGWAWVPSDPGAAVDLDVFLGDQRIARVTARDPRPDVRGAGHGTGDYGFSLSGLSGLLSASRERVSVRFADGGELRGSPRWVERPEAGLDSGAVRFLSGAVEGAVRAAARPEELQEPMELLGRLFARVAEARAALGAEGDGPRARLDALAGCERGSGPLADLARTVRARYAPIALPPAPGTPRVSVVVCAHNQFDHTYGCLESMLEQGARSSFEVVLVDDASTDATLLSEFVFSGGVRVLRNRGNLGFLRSANRGARAARGEFLLFLNNDTRVAGGWLDELVRTFELLPEVGVAGSKLVYPDGRLQEAGGIVGRLGGAANRGHGRDPDEPRFCHLRDADYVSGAALMVPRALFEELGGFDEEFAPAYYEDTDLCFRVRQAGRRVVVQPLSRVVHHEGASCGVDTAGSGAKRFQAVNQRKFFRRWESVLARHASAGLDPQEAERDVARRALFIDETVPTPDRDAGSVAAFEHIRLLQALGHKVTFLPATDMAWKDAYTADLQRLGVECLHAPHVRSVEEAFRTAPVAPDLVYLHRHRNAAKYTGLVREHFPDARLVYGMADLHFLRLRRQAELEGDAELAVRAARMERSELGAALEADAVIVHSHAEAGLLRGAAPGAAVHVVPWTVRPEPVETPASRRSGVAFIGGYAHPPNVDAARHLLRGVLPPAREAVPELRALLVGPGLPRDVAALADAAGAEVLGHVPDLGEVFERVRCTVAPLRYGAGVKGKVLTSMARGVSCVMSPIAAEGIAFPEALRWLVADSDAETAAKLVALHRDDTLAERLGEACLAFVREEFGAEVVKRKLAAAVMGCP